jgi:hypothetical protein
MSIYITIQPLKRSRLYSRKFKVTSIHYGTVGAWDVQWVTSWVAKVCMATAAK